MWPWLKNTAKMFTSDEDAFKRWAVGLLGLGGGLVAAYPEWVTAAVHVSLPADVARWVGIALSGAAGGTTPSVISGPPKP